MTTIYMIKNIFNEKVYIGQTTYPLIKRLKQHAYKNSGCIKLKNAIYKYGIKNFSIEELANCKGQDCANTIETFYIAANDSIKNGYNISEFARGSFFLGKHHTEKSKKQIAEKLSIIMKQIGRVPPSRKGAKHSEYSKQLNSISCSNKERKGIDAGKLKGKTWKLIDGKRIWMEKE